MGYPIKCELHPAVRRILIDMARAANTTQVELASDLLNQTIVSVYKGILANDRDRKAKPEGTAEVVGGQGSDSNALANTETSDDLTSTAG
jgi:hypothetical protein